MVGYGKLIEEGLVVITIIVAGLGAVISFMKGRAKGRWTGQNRVHPKNSRR